MTGRLPSGVLFAVLVGMLAGRFSPNAVAQESPKLPETAAFDKLVVDALREVHNRGADLYNTMQDFGGAYRMYQGGLLAVKPLLAHRPAAQKLIDEGFAAADKEATPARKAYKLHEAIENVRKHLKDVNEPPIKPIPDPKVPPEVAPKPTEKKPEEKKPAPAETKKPVEKKTDPATTAKSGGPTGIVLFRGQPLTSAELTFVSLDQPKPRVFSTVIASNGTYAFAEPLPAGRYVVMITAKTVPEKYQTTTTSGLIIDVKPGLTQNIELK